MKYIVFFTALLLLFSFFSAISAQSSDNSTSSSDLPDPTLDTPACTPAKTPGQFIFLNPTRRSKIFMNKPFVVNWTYSQFTDANQFPASRIDIYIQPLNAAYRSNKWSKTINEEPIDPAARRFEWTPKDMMPGQYVFLIAGDGKWDLTNKENCYADAEPIPSLTQGFRILEEGDVMTFRDNFAPNASGRSADFSFYTTMFAALAMALFFFSF